jgi:hypothetical protein
MRLEDDVRKAESYALSDSDIRKHMHGDVSIWLYEQLALLPDIRHLFKESNNAMLLYPTTSAYSGHWVTLMFHPEKNTIIYYDPYALKFDALKYSSISPIIVNTLPQLIARFKKEGGKFFMNSLRMQKLEDGNNTCGRHCLVRMMLRGMSNKQYEDYLHFKKLKPDEIVTLITMDTI